jgi:hypothetical protein
MIEPIVGFGINNVFRLVVFVSASPDFMQQPTYFLVYRYHLETKKG